MKKALGMGVLFLLASALPAVAHQTDKSFTVVSFRPDSIKVMASIDEADLLAFFGLDRNGDQLLQVEEMLGGIQQVFPLVESHIQVRVNGQELPLRRVRAEVGSGGDGTSFLNFYLSAPLRDDPLELDLAVEFFAGFTEGHRNLATILAPGRPMVKAVFSRENTQQRFVVGERRPWWEELSRTVSGWWGVSGR